MDESKLDERLSAFENRQQLFISQRLEYHSNATNKKIENVRGEIGNVRGEIGNVRDELGIVRDEIGIVRDELGNVRDELGNVRGEIGNVRGEIGNVRDELKQDVADVRAASETAHKEIIARLERIESRLS